jgi:hypothetical protein
VAGHQFDDKHDDRVDLPRGVDAAGGFMGTIARSLTTRSRLAQVVTLTFAALLLLVAFVRNDAGAVAPDGEPFERTWARTDKPVADLQVARTWMWGPKANRAGEYEPYVEGHDGGRFVQYYDKARMEITTDQSEPFDSPWFVTNGLLVNELMTGQLQLGDTLFEPHLPAAVNVAGDEDGTTGPTYAALAQLRDADPHTTGSGIDAVVDRFGNVSSNPAFITEGVTAAEYVPQTDHTVASVFWDFMNAEGLVWEDGQYVTDNLFENPFYATGYPVIEAYWTTVPLDGVPTNVLLQCFERRCLTYTPSNPDGWKVEAGNVGRHYYTWRYEQNPGEQTPTATATSTETSTPTSTPTVSPTATLPDGVTTTGDMEIESITDNGVNIRNMQIAGDIQMAGWQLRDEGGHVFTFPNVVVREGFYIIVRNCDGQDVIENKYAILYWGECLSGYPIDHFHLFDSTGSLVDSYP